MNGVRLLAIHFLTIGIFATAPGNSADEPKKKPAKPKEVAGKADVMKHVKKHFATFVEIEDSGEIRLHIEGEDGESVWPVQPDAQFKIDGWWGRPEQFERGDRAWVWLAVDRDKKPLSILMLANEISEQDIHGDPYTVEKVEGDSVTLHVPGEKKVSPRTLDRNGHELKPGDVGFVQSAGGKIRRFIPETELEKHRKNQQTWLRDRWRTEGLPGMIAFLHPIGGEMEVFLDHEGMRWARYLEKGDGVSFETERTIKAQVKSVEPWREKTRLRLVTNSGMDQLDLKPGQRISLKVPEPPAEVQDDPFPTDLGRAEGKQNRIDWFLATIYCPCGIAGDRCTGMFFTLASCNVNACGAPKDQRRIIGELIDEGLSDREVFERLTKNRGRDIWQPHLLR